jgi:uncharacterized protein YecE (DUF72 family)
VAGLWLGTSGFSYPEWKPAFYPEELPPRDYLGYYASRFNAVEIDSSFYRLPSEGTVDHWRQAVPESFRFVLKAPRWLSYSRRPPEDSGGLEALIARARRLGERCGGILYQLAPTLRLDLNYLERFLTALPSRPRAAFEFRHGSWYCPEAFDLLREREAALTIRDEDAGTTPLDLTAPFTLVRLRRGDYDPASLDAWRRRFRTWADEGLDVFAFVKHKDQPDAPAIAASFAA